MKFETYEIGNRVAIKTIKRTYSKVTHLRVEEAKKTIRNIRKNGWEVTINGEMTNKELIDLIQA